MPARITNQNNAKPQSPTAATKKMAQQKPNDQQRVPETEIKQNSGISATMALQAAQKAWDLRQAANAAGDPNAREEILAKAINKEIEAESFGKAAKYTQSGAFQGLAAGAGLGVQPGVTIGKLTGALVGGVVATVTGLLGGGIGSVYGALNGPFWNLGEMASHGVRGVIGDFPNWNSTPAQKRALEKMVMQTKETQSPSKEELEEMSRYAPDDMPQTWSQSVKDMTAWRPSMPDMPKMPSVPTGAALGLGGLGASMPSWGSKNQGNNANPSQQTPTQQTSQQQVNTPPRPQEPPKPNTAPKPKETPPVERPPTPAPAPKKHSQRHTAPSPQTNPPQPPSPPTTVIAPKSPAPKAKTTPKPPSDLKKREKPSRLPQKTNSASTRDEKEGPDASASEPAKRKPRKLGAKTSSAGAEPVQTADKADKAPVKKAPRKLASRKPAV
ncbi:hypothetical protein IAQ61_000555 [Plenodomus lingam]|uniref:Uncharacterized protein n=1 Tax=Leptosphaeria maculans (strain JN3 / isolate v23.1.3 / race Av1-4-5-6-7-8) TaxID=985895 RepID=E5A6R6_LEPMJ|nr:predicted protein [Plenodomus lingam JN3]KAH9880266.1 hypothetical protein IAQ61_000555 [Plenodomus lingam]CBX99311.1 predicted protein [Plenodomus lingam JN3]